MKKLLLIITTLLFNVAIASEGFDYSQVKPEHYEKLEHKSQFTDKQGDTYRIYNTKSRKGLSIQVTENGRKKWKKHGRFYSIYNGKVSGYVTYHYGVKHGAAESYNSKGQVKFIKNYENGQLSGSWQQFTDKGNLFEEREYVDGKKHGKQTTYHSNGQPNFVSTYVKGKREGTRYQYNEKGKLVARSQYKNGDKVGKTEWLY